MAAANPAARPRRRRWIKRGAILIFVFLAAFALAANLTTDPLARSILWVENGERVIRPSEDDQPAKLKQLGVARQMRVEVGSPTVSLSVWIMEPPATPTGPNIHTNSSTNPVRGTVLILPGIHDTKRHMAGLGRHFAERGYRAVLVDLRGQGRSSGRWATFGVHESRDLSELFDALAKQGLLAEPVVGIAESYGAATLIQLAAIEPRLRAVVAVAPFASMRKIVPHYVRRYLPGLGWLILDSSIQRSIDEAGRIADFDPNEASPLRAITRTSCPILLIHGSADTNIPSWHSESLHAAAPEHTELIIIPGANHRTILDGEYWTRVSGLADQWFDKAIR